MSQQYPDNNPKTLLGLTKVPLNLVPPSVKHYLAKAFADGARKYGPYNWRDKKVSASIYYAALNRHMDAWWDGEEVAADSKIEHLAHAAACIGILIDAYTSGNLIDDRPTKGAASRLQEEYTKKEDTVDRKEEPKPWDGTGYGRLSPYPVEQRRESSSEADVCTTPEPRRLELSDGGVDGYCPTCSYIFGHPIKCEFHYR